MALAGLIAGAVLTPALLPWLPGRAFSAKGTVVGLLPPLAYLAIVRSAAAPPPVWSVAAWFLVVPAVSSFFAMNFTGASTYTSLSGVQKEMRVAVPLQALALALGVAVWIAGRFA
jgi:acetyl-CoA decarbonylase/synthase complex subunit gamma